MEEFLREEPSVNYVLSGFIGLAIILAILFSDKLALNLGLKPRLRLARRLYFLGWILFVPSLYLAFFVAEGAILKTLSLAPHASLIILSLMLWREEDDGGGEEPEPPLDPDWDRFEREFYSYARDKVLA